MEPIKTHDDFKHPAGKIQLLNGNVLDCYPLEQVGEQVDNKVKLDTTGTYFSIGKRRLAPAPITDETNEAERKLFLDNAFRLLQHRNRIMSDSRMFPGLGFNISDVEAFFKDPRSTSDTRG